jgi:hypothetical protein
MTPVSPLVFPGSRVLAGWWKQLAPFQPQALWAGHLLLHRIEALAAARRLCHLDSVSRFVLRALAFAGAGSLQDLDQRLHLGVPLLRQLLRQLESEKLVHREEARMWSLTALGKHGLEQGSYNQVQQARRAFYFVEKEQPTAPPHFLNLQNASTALTWSGADGWRFEPGQLQACLGMAREWKQRFGFPLDVEKIMDGGPDKESPASASEAWQRIVVDRPERLMAVLVLVAGGESKERLLGFAVQLEGWILQIAEPAFVIDADWQSVFPDVAVDPPPDHWLHAWRAWCQPRGVPAAEVDACILERQVCRLRVTASHRLVERLRAARSDVFKGEAWLLAGTGRLRAAAQVELAEMKRELSAQPGSRMA